MTDTTENEQVEEPQETAEENLGDAGKKALAAERDARKQAEKQAAEFKRRLDEIEQANLSELEKAQKRAEAAEQALTTREKEIARLGVIAAKQIPAEYHDLIRGDTAEELEAAADKIAALLKAPAGPVIPNQGKTPDKAAPESADDWLRNLAKR